MSFTEQITLIITYSRVKILDETFANKIKEITPLECPRQKSISL